MASRARPHEQVIRFTIILALLGGAFVADVNTGYELSSSLFYIVPVVFTAWFLGRPLGLVVAVTSAVMWLVAQRVDGLSLSKPSTLYLNAGVECAIYLATAWAVARANADRIVERRLSAQVAQANEVLDREARAVGQLQRDLLPQQLPLARGFVWEIHYATSTRAGGDYYDAFPLPDGRLGIIVADATGHGAPAAVLMAMAKALLGAEPESLFPPSRVFTRLNLQLGRMLPAGWFLTACYVIVDPEDGHMEYALAGHESPVIVRAPTGAAEQLPNCGGLPLGPFPDHRYETAVAVLEPGDTLVLFTDGVTETMSPDHELFGIERLQDTLKGTATATLEDVKLRLLATLDAYAVGAPIADDTTILMLRRLGRHKAEGA